MQVLISKSIKTKKVKVYHAVNTLANGAYIRAMRVTEKGIERIVAPAKLFVNIGVESVKMYEAEAAV